MLHQLATDQSVDGANPPYDGGYRKFRAARSGGFHEMPRSIIIAPVPEPIHQKVDWNPKTAGEDAQDDVKPVRETFDRAAIS